MSRIYLPAKSADDWAQLLADPERHWRVGYSARTLAYSWQETDGFPVEIRAAFSENELLSDIELLLAIPEHRVPLPGGSKPSQNDIWALARASTGLVSIAVEGKVSEPFGPTLSEWLGSHGSKGKATRLAFLRRELNLNEALAGTIRYQLIHRTGSAVIEAKRFGAHHAVMLVHSFSPSRERFEDFEAFALLLRAEVAVNRVVYAGYRGGVHLHLGWICGDEAFLTR